MLLVLCVFIVAVVIKEQREEREAPTFKAWTLSEAMGEAGEYCWIDVEYMTEEFAIYGSQDDKDGNEEKYHFIISEGKIYIANISNDLLDDLQPIMDATYEEENFAAASAKRIYGITEDPTEELKEIAITAYNQVFALSEEDIITIDDYDMYFGKVVLNTKTDFVDTSTEEFVILITILIEIISAIVLSGVIGNVIRSNKYIKKNNYKEEIVKELNNEKKVEKFKNDNVYLTENYLLDLQSGLVVVRFSDIKWLYKYDVTICGIVTGISVVFRLKDGKTLIQTLEYSSEKRAEFDEIMNKIDKKLSKDTLKEWGKENLEAYKEYKRKLKKDK